jgi:MFS family permease
VSRRYRREVHIISVLTRSTPLAFVSFQIIYLWSFAAFFLLGFPVAFANHIAILLVFRFCSGAAGSAFLSVAGGSITDMWLPKDAFMSVAIYTCSTFLGPTVGECAGCVSNLDSGNSSLHSPFPIQDLYTVASLHNSRHSGGGRCGCN